MRRLTIYDRRERLLVRTADTLLAPIGLARRSARRAPGGSPRRVLCLRLERIGDLLMTLPALAAIRAAAPQARIDLVVGGWNAELARAIAAVDGVETLDAGWLARGAAGAGMIAILRRAIAWRARQYDLALNFEPDIRTNLALAASGARWTAGFASAGGGALLDVALDYDPRAHTSVNAIALARAVFGDGGTAAAPALSMPAARTQEAERLLSAVTSGGPRIGIHVSSGRLVKQWPEERFAELAAGLARDRGATIVLTGSTSDRPQVDLVKRALPQAATVDVAGRADLLTLAAVLARLDLLVTGDTGPMHLARAVGTPVVAVFGPSDPARYGPDGAFDQVVRVDLPCSPCNRIRKPPARCAGHIPDCLTSIDAARVRAAVDEVLRERSAAAGRGA